MIKLLKNMKKREVLMTILCFILILGQIFFDLKLPDFMSNLTKLIKIGGTPNEIWLIGLKMLGCTFASAILCIICAYLTSKIASGVSYSIRNNLFSHVMSLSEGETKKLSIPSLITRTTNDVMQIQMFLAIGLQMIIKAPIMAIWAIIKILNKSMQLSILTAVFVVLIITTITIIVLSVVKRFKLVQKLTDKINGISRENIEGINVVHAFNGEDYQNQKFDRVNDKIMKTQLKNQHTFAFIQPYMSLMMNGLALAIYWLGAILINNIGLTNVNARLDMFSNVVVFSTYATFVVMSFMMMVLIFMNWPNAEVSAKRINEVLETISSVKQGDYIDNSEDASIEFKNVDFAYPDSKDNCLTNINFKINKGQTLAIIGATGSGKTTLINLISRFYDVNKGEVLINNKNVKDYTFSSLYEDIGYISQKAILFSDTIENNVKFGSTNKTITDKDIDKAIKVSQSKEFVDKVENKKQYRIAQSGKNLSGGQKQRLSIARSLARKPKILIFDDSFSALDYKTDSKLRSELKKEYKDTTKVIVAQRISTIKDADKILVLDEGKVVGNGTHKELLDSCEVYQEIAKSQLSSKELGLDGDLNE